MTDTPAASEVETAQASATSSTIVEGGARFTERDFVAPFLATRRRIGRVSMFAASVALIVVSVLLVGRQAWLAGFSGAVAMMFGFMGIWQSLGPRYLARQHLQALHDDEIPVHYRFDEEGMTVSGSWGESLYRYRGLHAYFEYRTTILVQTGPVLRMVIPKRAFAPEDLKTVLALLKANVQPRTAGSGAVHSALLWRYVALWVAVLLLVLVAAGVIDLRAWR